MAGSAFRGFARLARILDAHYGVDPLDASDAFVHWAMAAMIALGYESAQTYNEAMALSRARTRVGLPPIYTLWPGERLPAFDGDLDALRRSVPELA